SHSLSPRFQNAAIQAAGVDGIYLALRCEADHVGSLIRAITAGGGAGNVTVPHKRLAAEAVESRTEAVAKTGACNTYWAENGRICGDNTDVPGFEAAVRALIGSLDGVRVLLLGAGGAARAALFALLRSGADGITLYNRTASRAYAMQEEFEPSGHRVRVVEAVESLHGESFDLVVNATSAGLHAGDPLPLELNALGHAGAALDMIYSPGETAWVRHARSLGIPAADGLEMLIQQGAASFERWWGMPAPLEAMRAALR
ncbi:MAG TPA: shikimate dehydrogenase, partial [Longimicrobiales bacterium]|nr:shikimate dehydrogenase [Longimicrobiales bacterium]